MKHDSLSRRQLLRGLGAAAGLPLLQALRAKGTGTCLPRLAIVYSPNGMYMPAWTPACPSGPLTLSPTLQPLEALRERCTVITGLGFDLEAENASTSGPHSLACAGFLSGIAPLRTEGGTRAAMSLDQVAAKTCTEDTWFPSLELACEEPMQSADREAGYSASYLNHLSWRSPYVAMPAETDPRAMFRRLFRGDAGQWIKNSYAQNFFGGSDPAPLAQYLSLVRDVERQVENVDALSQRERDFLTVDMAALAFQSGVTRVATIMLGREKSRATFPELQISETHHQLTHQPAGEDAARKLMAIDRYHTEVVSHFASRLASLEAARGNLLDSTLVLYGSGMSDGREHRHAGLPMLVLGGDPNRASAGRHILLAQETGLQQLHSAIHQWFVSGSGASDGVGFEL